MLKWEMNKNATVHSRIDGNLKENAEKILSIIGIKPSEAITMFYKQIVLQRGIPFKLEIPNNTTLKALEELSNPEELESFDNVQSLFSESNK